VVGSWLEFRHNEYPFVRESWSDGWVTMTTSEEIKIEGW
jgi:hypothetical protein